MFSVKEFAEQQGCSETIVYRHLRTYADELGETVVKDHGKTWLKPEACDILRSKMKPKASVGSPDENPKIQELQNEIERLIQVQKEKDAVYKEALQSATDLLNSAVQMTETLRNENRFLREENQKIFLLQSDNEAAKQQIEEEKKKVSTLQSEKEEIFFSLSEAKKQIQIIEEVSEFNAKERDQERRRAEEAEKKVLSLNQQNDALWDKLEEATKTKRNFFQRISDSIEKFFSE